MSGVDEALVELTDAERELLARVEYREWMAMGEAFDVAWADHLLPVVGQIIAARLTDADARVGAAEAERDLWAFKYAQEHKGALIYHDRAIAAEKRLATEDVRLHVEWRKAEERAEAAEERLAAVLAGIEEWDREIGERTARTPDRVFWRKHLRALASTDGTALARVKAEAWDEGEQAGHDNADDGYPDPPVTNPYRIEAEAGDS